MRECLDSLALWVGAGSPIGSRWGAIPNGSHWQVSNPLQSKQEQTMSSLESSSADGYPSCAVPEVEGFQPFNATTGPKPIGPFVPPRPRLVHAQQTAGCNVGVSSGSAVSARFDAKATLPDTGTAEALQSVLRQESELRAISGSGGQRVLPSRSDQGPVAAVPGQRLADDVMSKDDITRS